MRTEEDGTIHSPADSSRLNFCADTRPSSQVLRRAHRRAKNPFTEETISIPVSDQIKFEQSTEIPSYIEGLHHCTVATWGRWKYTDAPLTLFTTDKARFERDYLCQVGCELRPAPVSTSYWADPSKPNFQNVPEFGTPCAGVAVVGIFTNPWTCSVIEVPGAGCARFWIEFEFGRFIYPEVDTSLDVFDPAFVGNAEACFETKFLQGCRYW